MRSRFALAGFGIVATLTACGVRNENPTPRHVVELYFRRIVRDPIGTLPLLSQEFHASHGLRVLTRRDEVMIRGGVGARDELRRQQAIDAPGELSRARLGWLVSQNQNPPWPYGAGLVAEVVEEQVDGDRALVTSRVQAPVGDGFDQRFRLSRKSADEAWRIDAIEQDAVVPENLSTAFSAAPTRRLQEEMIARRPYL